MTATLTHALTQTVTAAPRRASRVAGARRVDTRRVRAERNGRLAEIVAAAVLILRGYRILARRHEAAAGEIDLVAVRGRRLAFVEVKQRASWSDTDTALRARQTARLHRAADQWTAARPYYRDHERGFDCMLVVPWSMPAYLADVLRPL